MRVEALDRAGRSDRLHARWMGLIALLTLLVPLLLIGELLVDGLPALSAEFLLSAPTEAGLRGGIGSVLVSTLWVLAVCMGVVLPLGLGCALFLVEHVRGGSRLERGLQLTLDVLGGVPSIVFGLFGNRFFAVELGFGFSILSGGLTLACMVLPLFIRAAEQSLRQCPIAYRQAAAALALSRWGFVRRILLPFAAPGIALGVVLSSGRALAETAVLLFTAGYVTRWPESWFDSGRTLAVHIYDLAMNVSGGSTNAAATALVLLVLAIGIQAPAVVLGRISRGASR
ncbi:phosphate ABC transporter permease PstA [Aromatoleum toluclasticum]|uniref:phosphate ABC transporter permease PstA n=1 Tax=Aromatoleum toluclasticum TaxID=92003 RepID=UPI001D182459|nr:phosphate ABC transporter permease PstA [Aromatoleum toluclasticum]MCC4118132.1 phosphate ABC transporter permease PstA [Aromatoleum toluclasticum]